MKVSGRVLARNTLLNVVGQGVILLVGLVTAPFIVRGLGTDRYGVLAIVLMLLGYSTFFDLGLGRATTKYVAQALSRGEDDEVPRLVWTTVTGQACLGILAGLVLAATTPVLVERVLSLPAETLTEARVSFYLLALSVPLVLVSASFRGVLEAYQRFDLVNAVAIPSSLLTYILPLIAVEVGSGLSSAVALIVLSRTAAMAAFTVVSLRTIPAIRRFSTSLRLIWRLLGFGGWVTVSGLLAAVLMYLERFMIGGLLSIAAVTYYTVPYEAANRARFFTGALTMTLFPAFSSLKGRGDTDGLSELLGRSLKYTLVSVGPIAVVVVVFAKDILRLWMGAEFATESATAFQVLALAMLVHSLAWVPFTFLQGVGRPDLPAKYLLVEIPVYAGIAWILISRWGIAGAGVAFGMRATLDAVLLVVGAVRACRLSLRLFGVNRLVLSGVTVSVFLVLAGLLRGFGQGFLPLGIQCVLFAIITLAYALLAWRSLFDDLDRRLLVKMIPFGRSPWLARILVGGDG